MFGDLAADLAAVAHRMPPVQAGPDARVVDLTHDSVHVPIGPLSLNQLRKEALLAVRVKVTLFVPKNLAIASVAAVDP